VGSRPRPGVCLPMVSPVSRCRCSCIAITAAIPDRPAVTGAAGLSAGFADSLSERSHAFPAGAARLSEHPAAYALAASCGYRASSLHPGREGWCLLWQ